MVDIRKTCKYFSSYFNSKKLLEEDLGKIYLTKDINFLTCCMEDVYKSLKEVSDYSFFGRSGLLYEFLRERCLDCEDLLDSVYIIESKPNFIYDEDFDEARTLESFNTHEEILDYIVYLVRKKIVDAYYIKRGRRDLDNQSLVNLCLKVSNYVKVICDRLGLDCIVKEISPGFSNEILLYDGSGFHYFDFVIIDDKTYIVDCTYRQFFTLENNNLERMGVYHLEGCSAGIYMTLDEERKKTALKILKDGWVEASAKNIKNYLDGFTLSYRNGLYYEKLGEANYQVSYTILDYINFLKGKDNIFNHENINYLGRQDKVLKNKDFDFKCKR